MLTLNILKRPYTLLYNTIGMYYLVSKLFFGILSKFKHTSFVVSWLDDANFNEVVRPFYGSKLPWLYKMWYPESLKKQAKSLITSIYPDAENRPETCEPYVQEKAKKCIQLLSEKLGTNEFLMGTALPSTIDAIAFSYLAPFWKLPLPHNPVCEYIRNTSNLERYLARILSRYFPAGL